MISSIISTVLLGTAAAASLDETLEDSSRRRLEYAPIAGYTPETLVTSQNALDLDQQAFLQNLELGTLEGYEQAMKIYTQGAFSEPLAYLNLTTPLHSALAIGDEVIGTSQGFTSEVKGFLVDNYPKGTQLIRVKYKTNDVQSSYVGCLVAANPTPKLAGCKCILSSIAC